MKKHPYYESKRKQMNETRAIRLIAISAVLWVLMIAIALLVRC